MRNVIVSLALAVAPLFAAEVPRKAPELVIQLPQGGQKLLTDYRGKVVVLAFFFRVRTPG